MGCDDADLTMDLVSKCSETLESLTLCNSKCMFPPVIDLGYLTADH